ncbi:conserved hypothetical protein [delta proteobacterium NaphS2]|nr:conserved hypothetical protein [delta proteobacterium NaphS2]
MRRKMRCEPSPGKGSTENPQSPEAFPFKKVVRNFRNR